jgi:superfamily II DNA or RNA helicase
MDAFKAGDAKIIINVGVLSCGWDHPEVRNIFFASPQRSLSRYEQRLGRGTRPLPGVLHHDMTRDERLAAIASSDKPTFHVYDITDSSRSHQILNALDVLDAKTRKSKARRDRTASALGSDGVSAVDAIAAQDAHDLAELEAKTAELIEKRKRLIVGVTFDHTTRDLFAAPTGPKKRGWRMLYGKYQGIPLTDIPADYLSWVLNSTKKDSAFKSAVRRELVERQKKESKQ